MKIKLTERSVAAINLPDKTAQVVVWDSVVGGFGVVVGRRKSTFIVNTRVAGKQRRVKIGVSGGIRPDGHTWNATRARERAKELLGQMASGVDPSPRKKKYPTMREGLELHQKNMRKQKCSEGSVSKIARETTSRLGKWMDLPITEFTGHDLEDVCEEILSTAKPRKGSVNEPGAALSNRIIRHVSAIWNTVDNRYDLPGKNPAKRVENIKLDPKSIRIPADGFHSWYETVMTLAPVRRDMQLVTLFTGMRSSSVRNARWEDLDLKAKLLQVRIAKGDKPYTVPLPDFVLRILRNRKEENHIEFSTYGGDDGWIFPAITRAKPHKVISVAEPSESRAELDSEGNKTGKKVRILPGLHALRRTHNSVAIEAGILREHREALLNHNNQGVNVKFYGRPQNWDHLSECQEAVATALLIHLGLADPA